MESAPYVSLVMPAFEEAVCIAGCVREAREVLARWGSLTYRSCHGIWVDSHRDLYVAQPGEEGGGSRSRKVVKYLRRA